MMFFQNKTKVYGLKKDTFISVSIKNNAKTKKTKKTKSLKKSKAKPKKKIRKKVDAINEDLDVDSLFDNVWTKKIVKKKKRKTDAKRIQEIQKSLDLESELNSLTNQKKNLDSKKIAKNDKNSKVSSGDEVNKYLAKIHSIVYNHFYPPPNSQGNVVVAVLEVSALGKMIDFRILRLSQNIDLNDEANRIKQRLRNVIFPKSPDNKNQRITIKLIPEDKE
jgi:protein TonB